MSKNVKVVGFGKAVLGMFQGLQSLLHDHIYQAVLSVPIGSQAAHVSTGIPLPLINESVEIFEGAENNIPDANALKASHRIMEVVSSATEVRLLSLNPLFFLFFPLLNILRL